LEWWQPLLHHPARLDHDEDQAYGIRTMCRALYTLEHGMIASKPVSGSWAQKKFEGRYSGLMAEALAWRPDIILNKKDEAVDFIRFTLEKYHL